ncbi:MAG: Ldh family oxidoreductase [Candidatus Rokubacteria bacterium]|nr:Ldh family oxidoreductase [Candidatus Rokubacteria bacterium]
MPVVMPDQLHRLAVALYERAGVAPEDARIVADHQVGANLAGHDSHGVVLLPTYLDRIRKGHIVPGAPIEILDETPTTARVNGNWGFGQVVSTRAMELAIAKARRQHVAIVSVFRQSHVGRLGDYPLMAARAGLVGLMMCDSGRAPKQVAPFGGREARLGTNPLSIAFPGDLEAPILIDMATSAAAGGKILVARARHEAIPLGWLVDKEGKPTTDPRALAAGGAMLPLGGPQGYKGSALSFAVETLAAILPGLGFGVDPEGRHNDGAFLLAFDPGAFRPLAGFKAEVSAFARYLKATPPAEGFTEVLYPGEIEYRTEQRRRREGIPIEDETWEKLAALARAAGLDHLV